MLQQSDGSVNNASFMQITSTLGSGTGKDGPNRSTRFGLRLYWSEHRTCQFLGKQKTLQAENVVPKVMKTSGFVSLFVRESKILGLAALASDSALRELAALKQAT